MNMLRSLNLKKKFEKHSAFLINENITRSLSTCTEMAGDALISAQDELTLKNILMC